MQNRAIQCRHCRYFRNDAAYLERSLPGLTGLSSGYGSASSDDGICVRHGRYLRADATCAAFAPLSFDDVAGPRTVPNPDELNNVP
jgi:hypothetical protein